MAFISKYHCFSFLSSIYGVSGNMATRPHLGYNKAIIIPSGSQIESGMTHIYELKKAKITGN